jgi:hypothetical protein
MHRPLIQSFAMSLSSTEEAFNTGFFSARYKVIDISSNLDQLYHSLDGFYFDEAVFSIWSNALSSHYDALRLANDYILDVNSDASEIVSPLELYFDYADMQAVFSSNEKLQPYVLIGTETRCLGNYVSMQEIAASTTEREKGPHLILQASDPCSGVQWCRTYFCRSGTATPDIFDLDADGVANARGITQSVPHPESVDEDGDIRRAKWLYVTTCLSLRQTVRSILTSDKGGDVCFVTQRIQEEVSVAVSSLLEGRETCRVRAECRDACGGEVVIATDRPRSCYLYVAASIDNIRLGDSVGLVAVGDTFLLHTDTQGYQCATRWEGLGSSPLSADSICVTHMMPYTSSAIGGPQEELISKKMHSCMKIKEFRVSVGLDVHSIATSSFETSHQSITLITDNVACPLAKVNLRGFDGGFIIETWENLSCPPICCILRHHVEFAFSIDAADIASFVSSNLGVQINDADFSDSGSFIFLKMISNDRKSPFDIVDFTAKGSVGYIGLHVTSDGNSFSDLWRHWKADLAYNSIPYYRKSELKGKPISHTLAANVLSYLQHISDNGIAHRLSSTRGGLVFDMVVNDITVDSTDDLTSIGSGASALSVSTLQLTRSTFTHSSGAMRAPWRSRHKVILLLGLPGSGILTISDQIRTRLASIVRSAEMPLLIRCIHWESSDFPDLPVADMLALEEGSSEDSLVVIALSFTPSARIPLADLIRSIHSLAAVVHVISIAPAATLLKPDYHSDQPYVDLSSAFTDASIGFELVVAASLECIKSSDSVVVVEEDGASKAYAEVRSLISRVNPTCTSQRISASMTWLDAEFLEALLASAVRHDTAIGTSPFAMDKASLYSLKGLSVRESSTGSSAHSRCLGSTRLRSEGIWSVTKLASLLRRLFPRAAVGIGADVAFSGWKLPPNNDHAVGLRRAIALAKFKLVASFESSENDRDLEVGLDQSADTIRSLVQRLVSVSGCVTQRCGGLVSSERGAGAYSADKVISVEANCGSIMIRLVGTATATQTDCDILSCLGVLSTREFDSMRFLLDLCRLNKLSRKTPLTKKLLSVKQLEYVQSTVKDVPLPSEWVYDGQNYVNFIGSSLKLRPDILDHCDSYMDKKNADSDFVNAMRDEYYAYEDGSH